MADFSDAIKDVLEQNDISVNRYTYGDADLEFYSPAGEEFCFGVVLDPKDIDRSFVDGFCQYAYRFDPDEHAEMWVPYRGQSGVPNSIRELLDDADSISEILNNVGRDLQKALVETKKLETSTEEEKADSDDLSLD